MRSSRPISNFLTFVLILFATLTMGGCGSETKGEKPQTTVSLKTGNVAILVTDGFTDDYANVYLTVTDITLLSDEGQVQIFAGEKRYDLLKLRDESSLFSVSSNVPVGMYDKIRLTVKEIRLIPKDTTQAHVTPALPANGKVDLIPSKPFAVTQGKTLMLQFDMDAEKCFKVVTSGNDRKVIFRPVVFIDVLDSQFSGKLTRLDGRVKEKDLESRSFMLCPGDMQKHQAVDLSRHGMKKSTAMSRLCVKVVADENVSFFDSVGMATDLITLMNDDYVNVVGRFQEESPVATAESDHDDDDEKDDSPEYSERIVFKAELIAVGIPGTFVTLRGTVDSPFDNDSSSFDMLVNESQGLLPDTILGIELSPGTRIFSRRGDLIDPSLIVEGTPLTTAGIIRISNDETDVMKTLLILLDTEAVMKTTKVEGVLSDTAPDSPLFNIKLSDTETACVNVSEESLIYFIMKDGEGNGHTSEAIALQDLKDGLDADIYGTYDDDGCLAAEVILAEKEAASE